MKKLIAVIATIFASAAMAAHSAVWIDASNVDVAPFSAYGTNYLLMAAIVGPLTPPSLSNGPYKVVAR